MAIFGVTDEDDLMVINKSGITIRTGADELRTMGRATQGVRLINLRKNDEIAAVCRTPKSEEEEVNIEGQGDVIRRLRPPTARKERPTRRQANKGDRVQKVWHGMC